MDATMLTVREAAQRARVSEAVIRAAIASGRLRSLRLNRRVLRVYAADLEPVAEGRDGETEGEQ